MREDESFAFQRAVSRLVEMQSDDYRARFDARVERHVASGRPRAL